jgi:hypothetical protein
MHPLSLNDGLVIILLEFKEIQSEIIVVRKTLYLEA